MWGSRILEIDSLKLDVNRRMKGAADVLESEFSGLRTGRASVSLLDNLKIDAYGQKLPMNQVGTLGVPEPRLLTVQVLDKSLVDLVLKAIRESELGLNPANEGELVRIPIPPLSEERRIELTKVASKYAEEARIAIRNVRRSAMDELKKHHKSGEMSDDQLSEYTDTIQGITDNFIKDIDNSLEKKENDIRQV